MNNKYINWFQERKINFKKINISKNIILANQEIDKITGFIRRLNYYYYVKNKSIVDDFLYDQILKMLIELENKFPELLKKNSPTQIITSNISKFVKKMPHSEPMLSIANCFDDDEIKSFVKRVYKKIPQAEFIIEPKIDGLSICLIYEKGKLVSASTRGDGHIGEIVTKNLLFSKKIPKKLNKLISIEIRGEIFLYKKDFEKILKHRNLKYGNQRNIASGLVRSFRGGGYRFGHEFLNILPYSIINAEKYNIKTQAESLLFLEKIGFKITKYWLVSKDIEKIIDFFWKISNITNTKIDYYLDGMVIKINNLEKQKIIGRTNKFPKWLIAYKFREDHVMTKLLDIKTSVGRTGKVTYVGILEKILIDNTFVSKVTLNNQDYIERNDIHINDIIVIKKAGGIIPKFLGIKKEFRNKNLINKFLFPTNCLFCNEKFFVIGKETFCKNKKCQQILIEKIKHFVSKEGMNIMGMGIIIIKFLVKNNIIKNFDDIYLLKDKKKLILDLNEKKILSPITLNRLLISIERSKKTKINNILFSLGINHVGSFMCLLFARKFKTIDRILKLKIDDILSIHGVGEKSGRSFCEYIQNKKNIAMINNLILAGVFSDLNEQKSLKNYVLYNKKIIISGIFLKKRSEMTREIENVGGIVQKSLSKNIDYYFFGKNPGSKKNKYVLDNNLKIYNENDFELLIKSKN